MNSNEVALSARLSAIAESLPEGSVVCDVGSDHGSLPLYLLSRGLCKHAIVTDLNEKPLQRAKENLSAAGVDSAATFLLTDGIEAVFPLSPDAFVIAGMGGETIQGILQRGLSRITVGTTLILQPMTKVSCLRQFLYEHGFFIQDEKLVYENKKYFVVICAEFDGVKRKESEFTYEFGAFLPNKRSELSRQYFSRTLNSLEGIIQGKRKAHVECADEEEKRNELLKLLEGLK